MSISQATAERGKSLRDVGTLVDRNVRRLIATKDTSATVATMARLRRNISREPGVDPSIWEATIEGVPGKPRGDAPTIEERAVHVSLTLFAQHQQGKERVMHQPRMGLGRAAALLDSEIGGGDGISPTRRRLNRLVTSNSMGEITHHLRGFVSLLKARDIGLDYGDLADDLVAFQLPHGADAVRRRWARQFTTQSRPDDSLDSESPESSNPSLTKEN